jgi:hypothetical protein
MNERPALQTRVRRIELEDSNVSRHPGFGDGDSERAISLCLRRKMRCAGFCFLKQHTQAAAFKKMTWENAHQVFKLRF